MVQLANSEQVYMVYDFESDKVTNVISVDSVPETSYMSLLMDSPSEVFATLISAEDSMSYLTSFSKLEGGDCDSDLQFESEQISIDVLFDILAENNDEHVDEKLRELGRWKGKSSNGLSWNKEPKEPDEPKAPKAPKAPAAPKEPEAPKPPKDPGYGYCKHMDEI